ncbi:hypothetical protein OC835_002361 [Tilletia horrida]|nr:hypothetical protein OC835_002361 [Tilletia horrida]
MSDYDDYDDHDDDDYDVYDDYDDGYDDECGYDDGDYGCDDGAYEDEGAGYDDVDDGDIYEHEQEQEHDAGTAAEEEEQVVATTGYAEAEEDAYNEVYQDGYEDGYEHGFGDGGAQAQGEEDRYPEQDVARYPSLPPAASSQPRRQNWDSDDDDDDGIDDNSYFPGPSNVGAQRQLQSHAAAAPPSPPFLRNPVPTHQLSATVPTSGPPAFNSRPPSMRTVETRTSATPSSSPSPARQPSISTAAPISAAAERMRERIRRLSEHESLSSATSAAHTRAASTVTVRRSSAMPAPGSPSAVSESTHSVGAAGAQPRTTVLDQSMLAQMHEEMQAMQRRIEALESQIASPASSSASTSAAQTQHAYTQPGVATTGRRTELNGHRLGLPPEYSDSNRNSGQPNASGTASGGTGGRYALYHCEVCSDWTVSPS